MAGGFEYVRIFLPNRWNDFPYWRSYFGASGGSKPGEFSSNFAGLVSSYVAHFFSYNSGSHTEWYPHAIGDAPFHTAWCLTVFWHIWQIPIFGETNFHFCRISSPSLWVKSSHFLSWKIAGFLSFPPWIRPFSVGCRLAPGRRRIGAWGTGANQVPIDFFHTWTWCSSSELSG